MLVSSTTRSAAAESAIRQSSTLTTSLTSGILLCDITASGSDMTPRSTTSSSSTFKKTARQAAGNSNKVSSSTIQLTAQELVASFKAMTNSSKRPPPPLPSPLPSPPQPPPLNPLNPRSNEDAFTLIDCISIFLNGGSGDGVRGGDSEDGDHIICSSVSSSSLSLSGRRHHRRGGGSVNLDAALNTVSSSCGGESGESGWRRSRSHRASRRRQHRDTDHPSRHRRCTKDARGVIAAAADAPVAPRKAATIGVANGQSGRRQSCHRRDRRHRRRSRRSRRRRCLDCFECFAADPLVAEATPDAAALEACCASAGVQRSEETCRIFLSSSCPQPRWAPAACCQPLLSAVAAARSASPSPPRRRPPPHSWSQPQPQTQSSLWLRRDVGDGSGCGCVGGRDGKWPHRGTSRNCNVEASSGFQLTAHHQPLSRICSLQREAGNQDAEEEDSASTDESLYISASTASLTARSLLRGYRRHLRTPQMATCHRVWVPAGAGAGLPPPRLPPQRPRPAAAAAASVVCTGLTRTATRTARSVSRQLRAVLFRGRRRMHATEAGDRLLRSPPLAPPPPLRSPPSSPSQSPQSPLGDGTSSSSQNLQQRQRQRRLDANNNRHREVAACKSGYCGAEYSSLLKTPERCAQRRQRRRRQQKCLEHHSTRSTSSSIELVLAAGSEPTDCRTVALISPAVSTTVRSRSPSLSPSRHSPTLRAIQHPSASAAGESPAMRRKVDEIIKTMSDSLIGLTHSLQGCVGHLHGTLAQLRSDARKYT